MTTTVTAVPAGWIYLIHTVDDPNAYIGQTTQPPGLRIEHHRRTQQWGDRILPGRRGYTIIGRVDSYGSPTLNAIALDLAEAEQIQRRNPTYNGNRPDPAIFHARMAAALAAHKNDPTTNPTTRTPHRTPRPTTRVGRTPTRGRGVGRPKPRRGIPWGVVGRIPVGLVFAWVALRVGLNVAHNTGTPWWPWVLTPVAFLIGPVIVVGLLRSWGWLPKPRRRGTRRRW